MEEVKFIFSGSFIKLTGGLYLWITVTQLLVKLMSLLTGTLIICPWHVLRICINNASLEIFSVPSEDREAPKTHVVMMMAPAGIILICLPKKLNPAAPSSIEEIQETQDLRFYGNDFLYVIDIFLVFSGDVVWTWEGSAGGGRGGL